MDQFGLPIAFGKSTPAPQGQARESTESKPARGGSSGRGDRGVVGGGKRNKRGRGDVGAGPSHQEPTVTSWDRSGNLASQYDAFNGGVKRSLNTHQPRQEAQPAQTFSDRGRGTRGRGRGGATRGRGGFGGPRKQETFHGRYLKESMWEDPWEEIILARQAGTA